MCVSVTRRYCVKTAKLRFMQTRPLDSLRTVVFWPPNLPEICSQSDPPFSKKIDFDQYPLITPQPWELAKKVELTQTGSRPRAFQRVIILYEPCTLPLCLLKSGSKREFLHFALPFISSLQIIVDTLDLVCGLIIASPSLQTTNRPWNGRVTH